MFNPIKGIRLIWHMRGVVGGYEIGKTGEVVSRLEFFLRTSETSASQLLQP